MKNRIFYIFLCIWGLFSNQINAQRPNFRVFAAKDGLPGTDFYDLKQGKWGRLWIASDQGINIYDGYKFHNISSDEGLTDETVLKLSLSNKNKAWALTQNGTLFEIYNDSAHAYFDNKKLKRLITHHSHITSFGTDSGDTLWIGLSNHNYLLKLVPVNGLYIIKQVFFNENALVKILDKDNYVYSTNISLNKKVGILLKNKKYNLEVKEKITSVCVSGYEKFLISINNQVYNHHLKPIYKAQNAITSLLKDHSNNTWLGIENSGLVLLKNNKTEELILPSVDVGTIYEDYEKGLWIGTLSKGLYYTPSSLVRIFGKTDGIDETKITSLYPVNQNLLLAGSDDGILYILEDGKIRTLNLNLNKSSQNQINAIFQSSKGEYWIACLHSCFRISPNLKNITELKHNGRKIEGINGFSETSNNLIIAAGNEKILHFYLENGNFIITDNHLNFKINAIARDFKDQYWLGCNNGLWKYNERYLNFLGFKNQLLNTKITDLAFAPDGALWAATHNQGVIRVYEHQIKQFTRFNKLADNYCNAVCADPKGRIWVGTSNGLSKITLQNKNFSIRNFNNKKGILGDAVYSLAYFNNLVYIGTAKGISVMDPENMEQINYYPPSYLTSVIINDNYQLSLQKTTNLVLPYSENSLEINFQSVSFKASNKIRYRYRLAGLEDHWHITSTPTVRYPDLPPGEYSFIAQSENCEGIFGKDKPLLTFFIKRPFYLTWWFISGSLIVFSGSVTLLVTRYLRKKHYKELREATIRKKLVDLELQALRAQMNPHFIFNCINSIQHFIVNNNSDEAQHYLSKFAKLMRNVLDNSKQTQITLQKELDTLQLYMQLESLRFDEKFEFEIIVDPTVDITFIEVPSMLIQPYIENAIWHGLMHKKEKGKITLQILPEGEQIIKCIIEDTGIGREKSMEYKSKNKVSHKSVGMMITKERLEILNHLNQSNLSIRIIDLKDESDNALGTRVEIFIPFN